jgi:hypothetical protein
MKPTMSFMFLALRSHEFAFTGGQGAPRPVVTKIADARAARTASTTKFAGASPLSSPSVSEKTAWTSSEPSEILPPKIGHFTTRSQRRTLDSTRLAGTTGGTIMKRLFAAAVCGLLLASSALDAQESKPPKSFWPFGRTDAKAKAAPNGFPALFPKDRREPADGGGFGLPSPTKLLNSMEQRTDAMFAKTRSTWKGVQDFGRSLLPFSAEPKSAKEKRSPFFPTIFGAKSDPQNDGPATVNEFLAMPRPRF